MLEGFFTAAGTLIVIAAILALCYFTTRRLGSVRTGGGRYIRLLDRVAIGQDKAVALIQAGEKYLLLGIANAQITVLAQMDESQIAQMDLKKEEPVDFKSILEALKDRKKQ